LTVHSEIAEKLPDNRELQSAAGMPASVRPLQTEAHHGQITPQFTELDVNGHVNNTRYISWLCDTLGNKLLKHQYLGDLVIGYEKEICSDDPLNISLSHQDDRFTFMIASQSGERHFAAGGTLHMED